MPHTFTPGASQRHAAHSSIASGASRHATQSSAPRAPKPSPPAARPQRLDPQAPDARTLADRIAVYPALWLDVGTGDGRFVRRAAEQSPETLIIGIDACYANLRAEARRAPANAAFIVADALALTPAISAALAGRAARVTINFPWGSLLRGLLPEDRRLLAQLAAVMAPGATLEARLNGGALAEVGWELAVGTQAVRRGLGANGFAMQAPTPLGVDELRACPTTWARRLAFGRDPRAFLLHGARS